MSEEQIEVIKIDFEGREIMYEASAQATRWRAQTLFSKEPDTVAWIAQFEPGDVFVDIGANVGMYTVLAAAGRGAQVYAFEPEAQNFAQLNRNILINRISDLAVAYPLALTDEAKVDRLYLSAYGLGGSCHTFGEDLDFHLKARSGGLSQGCVSSTLDTLIADGVIPAPNHIKIDVDGLEHLVVAGGAKAFAHPELKSVLVELNTHLPEHQALVAAFTDAGFEYEQHQVDVAVRQEGAFAGIGNYIFYRPEAGISFAHLGEAQAPAVHVSTESSAEQVKAHLVAKLKAMPVALEPYPYFYVEDIFPPDYYARMQAMKPEDDDLICLDDTGRAQGFKERFVAHLEQDLQRIRNEQKRAFWEAHRSLMCAEDLMIEFIRPFHQEIVRRGASQLNVRAETMFMRDHSGYRIGPHTDSPARLLSVMFYLPEDADHEHLGTSVYIPRQADFTCPGTGHHEPGRFEEVFRAPYKPNSAFGFLKTNNSFHGVPPMQDEYRRDTMVYIVKHHQDSLAAQTSAA